VPLMVQVVFPLVTKISPMQKRKDFRLGHVVLLG
jgi:hypothetical protein